MAFLKRAPFGLTGVALGAAALGLAMVVTVAGPFAPQQPVGVSIGEVAGDILKSTWRELRGQPQPAPVAPGLDIDAVLKTAGSVLGVVALVLGIVSRISREPRIAGRGAIWTGIGALAFQVFAWTVLMVLGALLLIEIVRNISGLEAAAEGSGGAGAGGGEGWLHGIGEFFGGLFDWLPGFGD